MFADLQDETGKIQIVFKEDEIAEAFALFRDHVDRRFGSKGTLFLTKRGEKSLEVKTWRLLSKALLPLPKSGTVGRRGNALSPA